MTVPSEIGGEHNTAQLFKGRYTENEKP